MLTSRERDRIIQILMDLGKKVGNDPYEYEGLISGLRSLRVKPVNEDLLSIVTNAAHEITGITQPEILGKSQKFEISLVRRSVIAILGNDFNVPPKLLCDMFDRGLEDINKFKRDDRMPGKSVYRIIRDLITDRIKENGKE